MGEEAPLHNNKINVKMRAPVSVVDSSHRLTCCHLLSLTPREKGPKLFVWKLNLTLLSAKGVKSQLYHKSVLGVGLKTIIHLEYGKFEQQVSST